MAKKSLLKRKIAKPGKAGTKQAPVRDSNGRWKPGQSGNPKGYKKGSKHKATLLMEQLLVHQAEELLHVAINKAASGNVEMLKFLLDRILPKAKERPVKLSLPESTGNGVDAVLKQMQAVFAQVANGEITPAEGVVVSRLLVDQRTTIELERLERRVASIEADEQRRAGGYE